MGFGRSLTVHLPNMNHSSHAVATCHECVLWGACWEPLWFWEAERYRNREAPLALLPTNPLCTTPGWHTNDGGNDLDFCSGTSYRWHKTLWTSHFHMNSDLLFSCCCFFFFFSFCYHWMKDKDGAQLFTHSLLAPNSPPKPSAVRASCGADTAPDFSCTKHVSMQYFDENQPHPPCFPIIGQSQQSCTWGRILHVRLLLKLSLT